jgi:hypothetical protein
MRKLGLAVSILALSMGVPLAGCKSAGETGGYNPATGNLTATMDGSLERVHTATVAAAKDMGYNVKTDRKDATQGEVSVTDAANKTIDIHLRRVTDRTTEVTIDQEPVMGSESKARMLFDKIRSRTGGAMGG